MRRIDISEARPDLTEILIRVANGKERVIVLRRGKELAALVPLEDVRRLEYLERGMENCQDRYDSFKDLPSPNRSGRGEC